MNEIVRENGSNGYGNQFRFDASAAGGSAEIPEVESYGDTLSGAAELPDIHQAEGQTDLANARRFVAMHGHSVRYCHPWKKWLVWDGCRWKIDDDGAPIRMAKTVADQIWRSANALDSHSLRKFATATAGRRSLSAMLALAESDVPILPDELDVNPVLLNCLNGTIGLRTGELREHRREDNITLLCSIEFDPDASAPTWERFQLDVAGGDSDLVAFKRRFYGYSATGHTGEQVLGVFYGNGANGKSTELAAIQETLGGDYCGGAPKDLLVEGGRSSHIELVALFGKRLVVAQETKHDNAFNEALVKSLTGGDTITARRHNELFWDFQPTHQLALCTNHLPRVRGTDHAIWRRMLPVPFTETFAGNRQDRDMPAKLRQERAGILAWIVRGAVEWAEQGLNPPESVLRAKAAYQSSQDIVLAFINDCCTLGDGLWTSTADLRTALEEWQQERGDNRTIDATTLGGGLERNNCTSVRKRNNGKQARGWQGIGLLGEQV